MNFHMNTHEYADMIPWQVWWDESNREILAVELFDMTPLLEKKLEEEKTIIRMVLARCRREAQRVAFPELHILEKKKHLAF